MLNKRMSTLIQAEISLPGLFAVRKEFHLQHGQMDLESLLV
jgi:hypothetical protein